METITLLFTLINYGEFKMNMKMKALAAALALSAAGTANAGIDSFGSGNGELFFSIRDNVAQTSYALDMNVTMNAWDENANQSWAADSTLTSFLGAGSGDYSWAVMAGDSNNGGSIGGLRYLSTSAAGTAANWGTETNGGLNDYNILDTGLLIGVNAKLDGAPGSVPGTLGDSATFVTGESGYFNSNMDTWSGNAPVNAASAGIGGTQSFYFLTNSNVTTNPFLAAQKINVTEQVGTFTLAGNGDLNYVATPIPAAVWLLGSAMVGLVGVARRREDDQVIAA